MRRWVPSLLLTAAVFAVACGGGSDGDGDSASATPAADAATPTVVRAEASTCEPALEHAAGTFATESITTSDGRPREYILHVPASYSGSDALPLILNFHGFGLTADVYSDYTGLNAKADEASFIAVTPQGLRTEAISAPHWNLGPGGDVEADDVAFVGELLDALEAQVCIDAARVYSAGYSNGAALSVRLACELPDRIAAIAPVAGVFYPDPADGCPNVPIIAFHGTADPLVPLNGRPAGGAPFGVRDIDDQVIPQWAEHNGCPSQTEEDPLAGTTGVRLVRNADCNDDASVELYVIEDADPATPGAQGGGHTWPGATRGEPDDVNNPTSQEISANDLIWDFFAAHPSTR